MKTQTMMKIYITTNKQNWNLKKNSPAKKLKNLLLISKQPKLVSKIPIMI